jgi:hypothetical protein
LNRYLINPTPTLSLPLKERDNATFLPLKERDNATFLPLQGGGQEGDGDLSEQYKYGISIMDLLENWPVFLRR